MRLIGTMAALLMLQAVPGFSAVAQAGDSKDAKVFKAKLSGIEETPAIITDGTGSFRARFAPDGNSVEFELTYSNLSAPATVGHIHLGQRGVAGGVAVFLCGGGGKPACPATGGTITGTFTAADVVGPTAQGLQPGDYERLIRAAKEGITYVNVHSTLFPQGELRGQIKVKKADEDQCED